jgi:LmbE family N-acetylglucosaminyl deacetylase
VNSKEAGVSKPIRILVVLAHPDDPEFYCGGTVALWAAEGRQIIYCLLTQGEKGNDDGEVDPLVIAQIRVEEQRRAADILGVEQVIFLDHPDGYLTPDLALRRDVVRVIRQVRPEIVITCDPTNFFPSDRYINHPDHRAAGQATLDAVYPAAGSGLYFSELNVEEGLSSHKVNQVYIAGAQQWNTVIDVTDLMNAKLAALREHTSQIHDFEAMEERLRKRMLDQESPPDSPRYVERFKRIDLRR